MKYISALVLAVFLLSSCTSTAPSAITLGNGAKEVELYMDFTCPGCKKIYENTLSPLIQSGKIKVILRDFPLTGAGLFAHNAVWCASKKGKEKEIVDYLFSNQDGQRIFQIAGYGEQLGLGDDFRTCIENQEFANTIDEQKKGGLARGVSVTPTVFIGEKKFETSVLSTEIEALLNN